LCFQAPAQPPLWTGAALILFIIIYYYYCYYYYLFEGVYYGGVFVFPGPGPAPSLDRSGIIIIYYYYYLLLLLWLLLQGKRAVGSAQLIVPAMFHGSTSCGTDGIIYEFFTQPVHVVLA
jgi:hypothetical protein